MIAKENEFDSRIICAVNFINETFVLLAYVPGKLDQILFPVYDNAGIIKILIIPHIQFGNGMLDVSSIKFLDDPGNRMCFFPAVNLDNHQYPS